MQVNLKLVKQYEDLIKEHEAIALENVALAAAYKASLADLLNKFDKELLTQNIDIKANRGIFSKASAAKTVAGEVKAKSTFKVNLISLLEQINEPLTASQLREYYNVNYGSSFTKDSFSPGLSIATKTALKKYIIPGNPLETRNYYGLVEWFDGDILKKEYLEKIKPDKPALNTLV